MSYTVDQAAVTEKAAGRRAQSLAGPVCRSCAGQPTGPGPVTQAGVAQVTASDPGIATVSHGVMHLSLQCNNHRQTDQALVKFRGFGEVHAGNLSSS